MCSIPFAEELILEIKNDAVMKEESLMGSNLWTSAPSGSARKTSLQLSKAVILSFETVTIILDCLHQINILELLVVRELMEEELQSEAWATSHKPSADQVSELYSLWRKLQVNFMSYGL